MDQAVLQRVTLARPSGTLCGTARGAGEQQRLRTWIGVFFGVGGIRLVMPQCLLTRHLATGLSPLQPGTSFMAAQ